MRGVAPQKLPPSTPNASPNEALIASVSERCVNLRAQLAAVHHAKEVKIGPRSSSARDSMVAIWLPLLGPKARDLLVLTNVVSTKSSVFSRTRTWIDLSNTLTGRNGWSRCSRITTQDFWRRWVLRLQRGSPAISDALGVAFRFEQELIS